MHQRKEQSSENNGGSRGSSFRQPSWSTITQSRIVICRLHAIRIDDSILALSIVIPPRRGALFLGRGLRDSTPGLYGAEAPARNEKPFFTPAGYATRSEAGYKRGE